MISVDSNLLLRKPQKPARELMTANHFLFPHLLRAYPLGVHAREPRVLRRESILFFVAENLTFLMDLVAVKEVSVEILVVVIQ